MSTIKDNIRRIAETEELKKLIAELLNEGEATDKANIPPTTYFAYVGTNGGVNSSPQAPSSEVGSTEEEEENTDDATEVEDPDTPDGSGGGTSTDLQDAIDDGLQIGDQVREFTGLENCGGSGEGVLYTDGEWRPPVIGDLENYTADWATEGDPRERQWRSGVWYQATGTSVHKASNPYSAIEPALAEFDANDPPNAPHTLVSIESYDVDAVLDGDTLEATLNRVSGQFTSNITVKKTGCTVGVDAHCPSSEPINDWPSDDKHQLNYNQGQFQTNEFESPDDLVGPWQGNPSTLEACGSTGGQATFQAANNGGMIFTIGSGPNAGDSYILNPQGVVEAQTTDITPYLPSE